MTAELDLRIERHTIRASGHAGMGSVLADDAMLGENANWLLVVAVDSYNDGARLNGLNYDGRLFSKDTQFWFHSRRGGRDIAPGAGRRDQTSPHRAWNSLCLRNGIRHRSQSPDISLVRRLEQQSLPGHGTVICHSSHQLFFLEEQLEPTYPALQFGDTGAAYGLLALCLARADLDDKAGQGGDVGEKTTSE
jgi:hypothetical protein